MSSIHILESKTANYYYRPEEPAFDEYVYCEQCADYVFECCSIHGSLLVVPDDKLPFYPDYSRCVPRAALTIPHVFLHLAPSIIPGAGIGVFSTLTLPRGVRFGPYRGQRSEEVTSMYCWRIHSRNPKLVYVVDASNEDKSNWMRYVNCARHWREQNLVAFQYQGQLYYRTVKTIPACTELMVYYGSAYAEALDINLGMYNSGKYYDCVIDTSYRYNESFDLLNTTNITINPVNDLNNIEKSEFDGKVSYNEVIIETNESYFGKREELTNNIDKMQNETTIATKTFDFLPLEDDVEKCGEVINDEKTMQYKISTAIAKCGSQTFWNDFEKLEELIDDVYTIQCKLKPNKDNVLPITDRCKETNVYLYEKFSNKIWKCEKCQKILSNSTTRSRHYATHGNEFECTKCQFKTYNKIDFKYHSLVHEDKVYKCELCEYASVVKKYMNRHKKRHNNNKYK